MSTIVTNGARRVLDHFEPEAELDPTAQRKLRGHLEQIDYATYAANREILAKTIGHTSLDRFKHLAIAAAQARAQWVAYATKIADGSAHLRPDDVAQLASLRRAYEELAEAYEAMRRMVERGYLAFK